MADIQGFSRNQISFQMIFLDEMIDKENPVRAIDAFVDTLTYGTVYGGSTT
ncbi:MAG TPA: hypothetical protein VK118_03640 [Tetragenococcus sp.]|nr:hypothetical protein [Tetragenococcus sp.]